MTGLVHLLFLSMLRVGGVCDCVISWYDWSCASALSLCAKGRWSLWLCHLLVCLVLCICSFSLCQGLVESVIVSSPGMTGLVQLLFLSMPRIGGVCDCVISWYDWSCASALSLYANRRWSLWLCYLLVWLVLCICSFSQCQGQVESVIVSLPGMTGLVHLLFLFMPKVGGVCDCVISWYDWSCASALSMPGVGGVFDCVISWNNWSCASVFSLNAKGWWSLWLCHLLVWLVLCICSQCQG